MRKSKKLLSVILSICMIMTAIGAISPITAFAATVYDGSESTAVRLSSTLDTCVLSQNQPGIGGKLATDTIYTVNCTSASGDAYLNPAASTGSGTGNSQKKILVSYDMMFTTKNARMQWELWVYTGEACNNDVRASRDPGVYFTPDAIVLKDGFSCSKEFPLLGMNKWYNIAIEITGGVASTDENGETVVNGSTDFTIYINGEAYPCTFDIPVFGVYTLRARFNKGTAGVTHFDNLSIQSAASTSEIYDETLYQVTEIAVAENEKIALDSRDNTIGILNGAEITAAELKELIITEDAARLYSDSTCAAELADDEAVPYGAVLVTENANGAFRYYPVNIYNESIFTYEVNEDGETCTVTGYRDGSVPEAGSDLTVPATVAGYTVTAIGANAFRVEKNYSGVKLGAVTLPDTVKTIGTYAFYDTYCSISEWPDALETIGAYSFVHNSTSSGVFPAGLKSIGEGAFKYVTLSNITLPDGLEALHKEALYWCGSLGFVTIPDSVTTLGEGIFHSATSLSGVRFPRNSAITAIPENIFTSNYPLRNNNLISSLTLYIPETITSIPDNMLQDIRDNAKINIYGVKGSAAWDFYLYVKEGIENSTYYNRATYPYTGAWTNPTDADGDGKGEISEINFIEYDFVLDTETVVNTNINTGNTAITVLSQKSDPVLTAGVSGVGGKLASDSVISLTAADSSAGTNYLSFNGRTVEISIMTPDTNYAAIELVYYKTAEKDNTLRDSSGQLFRIDPNQILVAGKKIADTATGEWHSFAVVPGADGSSEITVYVDGTAYPVELSSPYYGTNRYAFFKAGGTSTVYIDNIRTSSTVVYYPKKDMLPTIGTTATDITIADGTITYASNEAAGTAAALKEKLTVSETGSVRIYTDNTYSTMLADTDTVANGNIVVVADTYGYNTERAYSYYTVAVPAPVAVDPEVSVMVTGGIANVSVNGGDTAVAPELTTYPVGTVLTYTAVPDSESKVFLYWQDASSKAILSTSETIEVTVGSNAEYKAVYSDSLTEVYVTFKSNKKILAAGLKGAVTIPADPYMAGYTFDGWYLGGVKTDATLDVSENTVYTAGFKADTATYAVTIEGANQESGEYKYNDKVTVTPAGEEGKVFASWSRDGEVVSYSEEYSFYVSGKTTVVANYADSAVEKQIVLTMAQPVVVGASSDKIAFYAERNVPEGYSVIETGIILSQADSFTLTTSGVIKAKATSTANIGQYTVRKANVSAGDTWNAKAYLIYTDGTDIYTLYSNQVTKTL